MKSGTGNVVEWQDPLSILLRQGARDLIESAVEAEVADFLGRARYERDPKVAEARGHRNGRYERDLVTTAGVVKVAVPKTRGTPEPFRSAVLPRYARRQKSIDRAIPWLYAAGHSTRDIKPVTRALFGKGAKVERTTVSRLNRTLIERFEAWRRRDLSTEEIVYLFLDGFYLGVGRHEGSSKRALLVAHGVRAEGSRTVLGLDLGGRESAANWEEFLADLHKRGLRCPILVVCDGNPGLLAAVAKVFPEAKIQRCTVHKRRNVAEKIPVRRQGEFAADLRAVYEAETAGEAKARAEELSKVFKKEGFDRAARCLLEDLDETLAFYRFPKEHWRNLRTTNILERLLEEIRRRTKTIGRFPREAAVFGLVFAVVQLCEGTWRKITMTPAAVRALTEMAPRSHRQAPAALAA
jgi:transposase-like protein